MESSPRHLFAVLCLLAREIFDKDNKCVIKVSQRDIVLAIAESSKKKEKDIKLVLQQIGDLALVAERNRPIELLYKRDPLDVEHLFIKFKTLAEDEGASRTRSNRFKMVLMSLFKASSTFGAGIIVRLLQPPWEPIPAATLLHALARAAVHSDTSISAGDVILHLERAVELFTQLYERHRSIRVFCDAFPCTSYEYMPEVIGFAPGIPLKLMEAEHTHGISEIFNKFDFVNFVYESNDYDDVIRAQVHCFGDGVISIYVDHALVTDRFPDVLEIINSSIIDKTKSFVLDIKVHAIDKARSISLTLEDLPNLHWENDEIVVNIVVSDILYFNGSSLLQTLFKDRFEVLEHSFEEVPGIKFLDINISSDLKLLKGFLNDSAKSSLIVKSYFLDSTYEPHKKLRNWLILKDEDLAELEAAIDGDLVELEAAIDWGVEDASPSDGGVEDASPSDGIEDASSSGGGGEDASPSVVGGEDASSSGGGGEDAPRDQTLNSLHMFKPV